MATKKKVRKEKFVDSGEGVKILGPDGKPYKVPKVEKDTKKKAGDRLGTFRAYLEYNSMRERVYGVLDEALDDAIVGQIVWIRPSDTWKVEKFLDAEQNERRTLGTFTVSDPREGVKRALAFFQGKRSASLLLKRASELPVGVAERREILRSLRDA